VPGVGVSEFHDTFQVLKKKWFKSIHHLLHDIVGKPIRQVHREEG
jgi:hypothetical protein